MRFRFSTTSWIFIATICLPLVARGETQSKTPTAIGYGGAVATISTQASQAALTILKKGGNAIDAAVAAAAALGVTDPFSCGIGGGGFMMIYYAKDGRIVSIDHRETAPAQAASTMFLENNKQAMAFEKAVASGLSVGVPGTVRGWHEALTRFGTMPLSRVLAPAIKIAEDGFRIDENFHRLTQSNENKFSQFTSTSKLYLKDGKALPIGTLFKNPDMARAYREIGQHGVRYFYEEKPARAIVAAIQKPPTRAGVTVMPGSMTLADLANYETRLRLPVHTTYRGYDIYGMGLPSSGGIAIGEALNILEGYDLKKMSRSTIYHLYLETSRLVFADRNAFLADPEFVEAPVLGLLSKAYASERRKLIKLDVANQEIAAPGNPYQFQPNHKSSGIAVLAQLEPALWLEESEHTTHLTVTDRQGNIVAYTFTIEDWGGSGIVVPGYGFLLNNEMTDFDFVGASANLPGPGKRPRSSMSPTFVFKAGKPVLSLGSPGGSTIITTVLQTLVNFFDLGMLPEDALSAPRMSQRNGKTTLVEPPYIGTAESDSLLKLGHHWAEKAKEIGAANALWFGPNGQIKAVSEPKRHGIGSSLVESKTPLISNKTLSNAASP